MELDEKLKKYSVLVASLGSSFVSNGEIIYVDVSPDIEVQNSNFEIDLNGDSINDFKIRHFELSNGSISNRIYGIVNPNNEILLNSYAEIENVYGLNVGLSYSNSNWYESGSFDFNFYGTFSNWIPFVGEEKIVGVKFEINDNEHYGWIRMGAHHARRRHYSAISKYVVFDYAYESCAYEPIVGGDTIGGDAFCDIYLNTSSEGCDVVSYNGVNYYDDEVIYTVIDSVAPFGKDSIIRHTININNSIQTYRSFTGCQISLNGINYTGSTIIYDTIPGVYLNGCDSIIQTNIIIQDISTIDYQTFKNCTSINYNGVNYSESILLRDTLLGSNQYGCDSIIQTNIIIQDFPTFTNQQIQSCESVNYYGIDYSQSTVVYDTLFGANQYGCDSIIETEITVNQFQTFTNSNTFCDSGLVNGEMFYSSQLVIDTINTLNVCEYHVDTIIVLENSEAYLDTTLFYGQELVIQNYTYLGNYQGDITLEAANGCDSIVHANINFIEHPDSNTSNIIGFLNDDFSVFPNPFNETIVVKLKENVSLSLSKTKSFSIRIFDITSKELISIPLDKLRMTNHEIVLDVSQLQKGIYILEVEGVGRTKIVKD